MIYHCEFNCIKTRAFFTVVFFQTYVLKTAGIKLLFATVRYARATHGYIQRTISKYNERQSVPYEPANTYGGRNGVEGHFINFKQKSQKLDKIHFQKNMFIYPLRH